MSSLIASGNTAQLFATPIWSFRPVEAEALARRVAERVREVRRREPGAGASSYTWQSSPELHLEPAFGDLAAVIAEAARAIAAVLAWDCELALTSLWGNVSGAGEPLHAHTHPNNLLSGVFYACAPEGAGATSFSDPRPQARVLRPKVLRDTPLNSTEFRYRPTEGTLLLFPAWLEHAVTTSSSAGERITVAFNLMVKGPLGEKRLLAYSEV
jgi:uncharacterized protein (TIGR02466 family)